MVLYLTVCQYTSTRDIFCFSLTAQYPTIAKIRLISQSSIGVWAFQHDAGTVAKTLPLAFRAHASRKWLTRSAWEPILDVDRNDRFSETNSGSVGLPYSCPC